MSQMLDINCTSNVKVFISYYIQSCCQRTCVMCTSALSCYQWSISYQICIMGSGNHLIATRYPDTNVTINTKYNTTGGCWGKITRVACQKTDANRKHNIYHTTWSQLVTMHQNHWSQYWSQWLYHTTCCDVMTHSCSQTDG